MWGRIRLAERRGLLQGRRLSRVQEEALTYLMFNEVGERDLDLLNQVRVAASVGVNDVDRIRTLFPEFAGRITPVQPVEIQAEEIEDFEGTLVFEPFDPVEAMRVLAELGIDGSMNLQDVMQEQDGEEGW